MPTKSRNCKSQHVAVRLPHEIDDCLRRLAEIRQIPYSQIVIEALTQYIENKAKEQAGK